MNPVFGRRAANSAAKVAGFELGRAAPGPNCAPAPPCPLVTAVAPPPPTRIGDKSAIVFAATSAGPPLRPSAGALGPTAGTGSYAPGPGESDVTRIPCRNRSDRDPNDDGTGPRFRCGCSAPGHSYSPGPGTLACARATGDDRSVRDRNTEAPTPAVFGRSWGRPTHTKQRNKETHEKGENEGKEGGGGEEEGEEEVEGTQRSEVSRTKKTRRRWTYRGAQCVGARTRRLRRTLGQVWRIIAGGRTTRSHDTEDKHATRAAWKNENRPCFQPRSSCSPCHKKTKPKPASLPISSPSQHSATKHVPERRLRYAEKWVPRPPFVSIRRNASIAS